MVGGDAMTYDEALQQLIDELLLSDVRDYAVVVARDVRGRLRVCVDGAVDEGLETRLTQQLGPWFAPPVLSTQGNGDNQYAAKGVLEDAKAAVWPPQWPPRASVGTGAGAVPATWKGLRPTVAKGSWLNPSGQGTRLQHSSQAVVVGFHSFKGGVGRTTTLAMMAVLAAADGHKVVVVDLDVEAPGLHHVFSMERSRTGALDMLVEAQATGTIADVVAEARENAMLHVVHAGATSATYLERLGHLDYAAPC
jgi:hypothetical protein